MSVYNDREVLVDVNILWVVVVGVVIGVLARLLMPGRDPIGFVATAIIGIVGALLGTYLWEEVLFKDNDNGGVALVAGVVVAVALLAIYRKLTYGGHRA